MLLTPTLKSSQVKTYLRVGHTISDKPETVDGTAISKPSKQEDSKPKQVNDAAGKPRANLNYKPKQLENPHGVSKTTKIPHQHQKEPKSGFPLWGWLTLGGLGVAGLATAFNKHHAAKIDGSTTNPSKAGGASSSGFNPFTKGKQISDGLSNLHRTITGTHEVTSYTNEPTFITLPDGTVREVRSGGGRDRWGRTKTWTDITYHPPSNKPAH
jgi:hypothetical protein